MPEQKLQYTISARDQSRSVLRNVLGDLGRFSGQASAIVSAPFRALGSVLTAPFKAFTSLRGLGLMANLQILKGLGSAIEAFVERGSRVNLVAKSFEALTGETGQAAQRLVRQLKEAAGGTITMTRAMEIANRSLASGLSAGDLAVALEFVSKKAITTGKDAGQAIDTVITGLSRGSTLFLDDFGILVDGIDGVARDFDRIHGKDAFEQLGPAAQKAEIIRAAVAEMRLQLKAIGISGREVAFSFQSIRSAIGDGLDKLASMIAGNKTFQGIMKDIATVVQGMASALGGPDQAKAFEKLGHHARAIFEAIFKDIGNLMFDPVLPAIKNIWSAMVDGAKAFADLLGELLKDAFTKAVANLELMLGDTGLFKGVFDLDAARKVADAPGPTSELLEAVKKALDLGKPHEVMGETGKAFHAMGQDFGLNVAQPDPIQAAQQAAKLAMRPGARARSKDELRKVETQFRILNHAANNPDFTKLWENLGALTPFRRQADQELNSGALLGKKWRELPHDQIWNAKRQRTKELADNQLKKIMARRDELEQALGINQPGVAPAGQPAGGAAVAPMAPAVGDAQAAIKKQRPQLGPINADRLLLNAKDMASGAIGNAVSGAMGAIGGAASDLVNKPLVSPSEAKALRESDLFGPAANSGPGSFLLDLFGVTSGKMLMPGGDQGGNWLGNVIDDTLSMPQQPNPAPSSQPAASMMQRGGGRDPNGDLFLASAALSGSARNLNDVASSLNDGSRKIAEAVDGM